MVDLWEHYSTKSRRRDAIYALSIPPQVAEALNLKAGGNVSICVNPVKKGKF